MDTDRPFSKLRTAAAAGLAMIAFAANSILCRLALETPDIDPAGFTVFRLASGAATLLILVQLSGNRRKHSSGGDWISSAALFFYAMLFSFAYRLLEVGAGALILFALVQVTMIGWGLWRGERPRPVQWMGLAAAFGGLIYLVSPGLSAPSPAGSIMMGLAGTAWGVYSLRGRASTDPASATAGNFSRTLPMVLLISAVWHQSLDLSTRGILLAIASGSLASGLGYVIWYYAIRGLTATRAAGVQLTVPVIAALGGLIFLEETASPRLVLSAILIVGGVGLTLTGPDKNTK